jgi:hypothetical protein
VVIAYNIINLFKQAMLRLEKLYQLITLRYRIFAIGGYLTKNGDQRILQLSLNMKRRMDRGNLVGKSEIPMASRAHIIPNEKSGINYANFVVYPRKKYACHKLTQTNMSK